MTASALVSTIDQSMPLKVEAETSPWWRNLFARFGRQRLALGMTVASLLLMLGGAWSLFEMQRLRSALVQSRTTQIATEQRERELRGLLAEQRDRHDQLLAELENLRTAQQLPETPSRPSSVSLLVTAGLVRDGSQAETPRLVIPAGIEQVRLRLKIQEGGYRQYRASIQIVDGQTIRTLQHLRPGSANILTIRVPSRLFVSGEYLLALSGVNERGESEILSKTLFRVESVTRTSRKRPT